MNTVTFFNEDIRTKINSNRNVVRQSLTKALEEMYDAKHSGVELPNARNLFKYAYNSSFSNH